MGRGAQGRDKDPLRVPGAGLLPTSGRPCTPPPTGPRHLPTPWPPQPLQTEREALALLTLHLGLLL